MKTIPHSHTLQKLAICNRGNTLAGFRSLEESDRVYVFCLELHEDLGFYSCQINNPFLFFG